MVVAEIHGESRCGFGSSVGQLGGEREGARHVVTLVHVGVACLSTEREVVVPLGCDAVDVRQN